MRAPYLIQGEDTDVQNASTNTTDIYTTGKCQRDTIYTEMGDVHEGSFSRGYIGNAIPRKEKRSKFNVGLDQKVRLFRNS
jgi:hypothetical protein